MRMILSRCPNCKRVVAFSSESIDVIVRCSNCGYKDTAAVFVNDEANDKTSSDLSIQEAWDWIRKIQINLNEWDIQNLIDSLSKQFYLSPSIIVELLNMALNQQNNTEPLEPTRLSELKGEEVLLQELLRTREEYQVNVPKRQIVIDASIFEQKSNEGVIEKLRKKNQEIEEYNMQLQNKNKNLIERLQEYE